MTALCIYICCTRYDRKKKRLYYKIHIDGEMPKIDVKKNQDLFVFSKILTIWHVQGLRICVNSN